MIDIQDKSKCCGCSACVQICPVNCISQIKDCQGFNYPKVDKNQCINCGLCERVCPFLKRNEERLPIKVIAACNQSENIREQSSSGGVFRCVAEYVIKKGGVVFGASYDKEWNVIHDYTQSLDGIVKFQQSKYVQSRIGDTFKYAYQFLKDGRLVLFSGTSCQIEGLKMFLNHDFENLITVDVVCHGVPSPLIYNDYLSAVLKKSGFSKNQITSVSFRDKVKGWKNYSFVIKTADKDILNETVRDNPYLQGFINNLYIRPACFNCPSKKGKSLSDFSLADFWSVKKYAPNLQDNKGLTLVYLMSSKAEKIMNELNVNKIELDKTQNLNSSFSVSTRMKYPSDKFWSLYYQHGIKVIMPICKKIRPNFIEYSFRRILNYVKQIVK